MYVYFDKEGNLKEVIYKPVRQGDFYKQVIYVYWDNDTAIVNNFSGKVKKSDGTIVNVQYASPQKTRATIPYDKDRDLYFFKYDTPYYFYVFRPQFAYPTGLNVISFSFSTGGQTIQNVLSGQTLNVMQLLPFNVEDSTLESGGEITQSEYSELLSLIKFANVRTFDTQPTNLDLQNIGVGSMYFYDHKIYKVNNDYTSSEWLLDNVLRDFQLNGVSVATGDEINILVDGTYSSTNKLLTQDSVVANPVPQATNTLSKIKIKGTVYNITGGSYEEGTGIEIENNTISVDTNVIQEKLTTAQMNAVDSGITSSLVSTFSGKQDALTTTQLAAANSGITASDVTQIVVNQQDIESINDKIPSQATSQNQLADKDFVNSSIASNTGAFKGTLDVVEDLELDYGATTDEVIQALNSHVFDPVPTNNDYCFVLNTDTNYNLIYQRFKYVTNSWQFEYALNNSSFTAAQWSAINSGATETNIGKITINEGDIAGIKNGTNINSFSGVETALTGKQNAITSTNKLSANLVSGLGMVATTNDYEDLDNKPTLPTKTSDLTNDSGFITNQYHDPLKQGVLTAGTGIEIDDANEISIDNDVVATQTNLSTGLATKQDTISDLATIRSGASAGATALQPSAISDMATKTYVDPKFASINGKIPSQASSSNQLADKAFVNSSIASATGTFKGTFNSTSALPTTGVNKNDYAFVISTDQQGNTIYNRYKYNGSAWVFEYALNNSSFTAEQWAAINSGITGTSVGQIATNTTNIANITDGANLNSFSEVEGALSYKEQKIDANHKVSAAYITGLSNVATSGNYSDLTNKPQDVSDFINDAGYITSAYHDDTKQNLITSTNKIPYSNISDTPNLSNYITKDVNNLTNYRTATNQNTIDNGLDDRIDNLEAKVSTWDGKSVVSGTNDGTNWQTITINGTTKNIPVGSSGGIYQHKITLDDDDGDYEAHVYLICSVSTAFNVNTLTSFVNARGGSIGVYGYMTDGVGADFIIRDLDYSYSALRLNFYDCGNGRYISFPVIGLTDSVINL